MQTPQPRSGLGLAAAAAPPVPRKGGLALPRHNAPHASTPARSTHSQAAPGIACGYTATGTTPGLVGTPSGAKLGSGKQVDTSFGEDYDMEEEEEVGEQAGEDEEELGAAVYSDAHGRARRSSTDSSVGAERSASASSTNSASSAGSGGGSGGSGKGSGGSPLVPCAPFTGRGVGFGAFSLPHSSTCPTPDFLASTGCMSDLAGMVVQCASPYEARTPAPTFGAPSFTHPTAPGPRAPVRPGSRAALHAVEETLKNRRRSNAASPAGGVCTASPSAATASPSTGAGGARAGPTHTSSRLGGAGAVAQSVPAPVVAPAGSAATWLHRQRQDLGATSSPIVVGFMHQVDAHQQHRQQHQGPAATTVHDAYAAGLPALAHAPAHAPASARASAPARTAVSTFPAAPAPAPAPLRGPYQPRPVSSQAQVVLAAVVTIQQWFRRQQARLMVNGLRATYGIPCLPSWRWGNLENPGSGWTPDPDSDFD